jgi:hypothetical protein
MKFRSDFVTNSSSSSFLISKNILTNDQIEAIREHGELAKRMNLYCYDETWDISENNSFITGYTWMDNFSMHEFFCKIGIKPAFVSWGEYPFNLPDDNEKPIQNNEEKEEWLKHLEDIRNGVGFQE